MVTQLLQLLLTEAIHTALGSTLDRSEISVKPYFPKQAQATTNNNYHYTSPIAFSLAHQLGRSPLEIAQILERVIEELKGDRFVIDVGGEGWLNFRLSDRVIADSLSALYKDIAVDRSVSTAGVAVRGTPAPHPKTGDINSAEISTLDQSGNFPGYTYVQYAYARCGALLRLAQKQELINVQVSLHWLDETGSLYLSSSTEMRLALCLVAIADEIFSYKRSPSGIWERSLAIKLSKNLAANFLDFYDACQIVSVKSDFGMARLGLVSTTQKVIRYLASGMIVLPEAL